ncbi:MAG: glycosyltransferase family 4 protein [Planctomycetota bacterium]
MKITFLMTALPKHPSGGPFMLYRFMDKLAERGYEVWAVTPFSRVKWEPDFSEKISSTTFVTIRRRSFRSYVKSILLAALGERVGRKIIGLLRTRMYQKYMWQTVVPGLIHNWSDSDVTIATAWPTAYAAYILMDKTIPMYYIQMYEELFAENEETLKLTRLTYFMPLVMVASCAWLREQIRRRINKDTYILHPGIPVIDCTPLGREMDLRHKFLSAGRIKIVSYAKDGFAAFSDLLETMRIVFSKIGKEKIEWNVFGFNPKTTLPDNIPLNYVKGHGKELIPLFLDSHIFLSAPWYGGFNGGALEAMSGAMAVIGAKGDFEDVIVDGVNGILAPARDVNAIANAVIKLVNDRNLAMILAEGGLKTASEFTWDKATDNLEKIIKEAMVNYPFKGKFVDIPALIRGDKDAIDRSLNVK